MLIGMILVTGATGTIGSEIVRQLAAQGKAVRAVTRDPARATVPAGVELVRGDFLDTAAMRPALTGAEAVFVVGVLGPEYAQADQALIDAAREAGVRRIVKLSAIGTGDPELGRVGTWHLPGEQATQDSGVEWTILRPSTFASNTLSWAEAIRAGQPVPNMTGAGQQGVIDPRDISAVAVAALLSGDHAGRIYTLTGPELVTGADQAAALSAVLDRPIDVIDVPEAPAREHMIAAGMSPDFVAGALAGQAYVRAGRNAVLTEDVHRILGRPARTYTEWATDHAALFTGTGNPVRPRKITL